MKKSLFLIIDLIIIGIFNILFFVIGGPDHIVATWISYAFIHIAFVSTVITPLITKENKYKTIFNLPIISFSGIYFLLQLIVNLIIIIFVFSSAVVSLLANIVLLSAYLISIISIIIVNKDTKEQEDKQQDESQYIKLCSSKLHIILGSVNDPELMKEIGKAYDIIRTSQLSSNSEVLPLQESIKNLIGELEFEVKNHNYDNAKEITNRIITLSNERNIFLKSLN